MNSPFTLSASEMISTLDQTGVVNLTTLTDLILARGTLSPSNGKAVRGFLLAHGFDSASAAIAWSNVRDLAKLNFYNS